ncbi:glucosamine-6-phosphate deaminase [Enterococcus canis]|nr:glucosamine-6-phosphate deaminase [Enterococcus canis]
MKKIIVKDYETLSEVAASIVIEKWSLDRRVNLSLTAGSTPKGMYQILLARKEQMVQDWSTIHYYNFDEVALANERYGLTMQALREEFYLPAAISEGNVHELNADNYQTASAEIQQAGGLDLVVMGLGGDGHFCGNLPEYTKFGAGIYEVSMTPETALYQMVEKMGVTPGDKLVTFGPQTVLSAQQLVLMVNGEAKAEILRQVLEEPVTEEVPASILRLHNNLTVIADEAAASRLS